MRADRRTYRWALQSVDAQQPPPGDVAAPSSNGRQPPRYDHRGTAAISHFCAPSGPWAFFRRGEGATAPRAMRSWRCPRARLHEICARSGHNVLAGLMSCSRFSSERRKPARSRGIRDRLQGIARVHKRSSRDCATGEIRAHQRQHSAEDDQWQNETPIPTELASATLEPWGRGGAHGIRCDAASASIGTRAGGAHRTHGASRRRYESRSQASIAHARGTRENRQRDHATNRPHSVVRVTVAMRRRFGNAAHPSGSNRPSSGP